MTASGAARARRRAVRVAALGITGLAVAVVLGGGHARAAAVAATAEPDVSNVSPAALRQAALLAAPSIVAVNAEITGRLHDDRTGGDVSYDLAFGGTGFFASADGYVVTAAHVAAPTDEQVHLDFVDQHIDDVMHCVRTTTDSCHSVEARDEPEFLSRTHLENVRISLHVQTQDMTADDVGLEASLVTSSASGQKDVAVVKVDVHDAPILLLRKSLASIDSAIAVEGYPESKQDSPDPLVPTVTSGRVTDTRAGDPGFASDATVVETDAHIEHGNSGGPGIDEQGDVVGIVSYGPAAGLNYMISAGDVAGVLGSTPAANHLGRADDLWRGGLTAQAQGDTTTARQDYERCAALSVLEVGCAARTAELGGNSPQSSGPGEEPASSLPDLTGAPAAAWMGAGLAIGVVVGTAATLLVLRAMPRREVPSTAVRAAWAWRWGPNGWTFEPHTPAPPPTGWRWTGTSWEGVPPQWPPVSSAVPQPPATWPGEPPTT